MENSFGYGCWAQQEEEEQQQQQQEREKRNLFKQIHTAAAVEVGLQQQLGETTTTTMM